MGTRHPLVNLAVVLTFAGSFACSDSEQAPSNTRTPSSTASATKVPAATASPPGATRAPAAPAPTPTDPAKLAERGRSVYMSNCIACHNVDPGVDGALGPAIAGSPASLLEARVVRGDYPEGYSPKRDSKIMVALPHLEPDIAALATYLAQ